jgi:alanine racemase
MVRFGNAVYGIAPSAEVASAVALDPVMTLRSAVSHVHTVEPGDGVSYGHRWRAPGRTRVAVVPIGYADGYPRALSNRGEVLIAGTRAPVVGRICMDHTMIDVTGIPGAKTGDAVCLWGPDLGAEDVAARADTISYELVARVGVRVERRYVGV